MDDERNLGVTEGRFALTILTCLLVAIGYIALLRWGGTKDTTVDLSPDDSPPTVVAEPTDLKPSEPTPRMLQLEPDNGRGLAERPPADKQLDPKRR